MRDTYPNFKKIIYCNDIPKDYDKKSANKKYKKCVRKRDGKEFSLPRLYSKKSCEKMKKKGYTQRSSCAPYEN